MAIVLVLSAWFGFVAADRWLTMPRSTSTPLDEPVVLCTVSAFVALTVRVALG